MSQATVPRIGMALAVLLFAGACGGDGGDVVEPAMTTTTVAPTTTTTTTVAPTTTTTTTTEAPIVLTDSFRGVTAEAIRVGFTSIDFERLNRDFGLTLTYANYGPSVDALVADLNARGGILGRRIEVVHRLFLPVGPVSAEAACVELTGDEEVFAVLNGFAGPGAESVNECFVDTYETILVGGGPTPEQLERARATWITTDIGLTRRGLAFVNLLREAGWLDDLGVFMVYGANVEALPIMDAVAAALEAEGVSVPVVTANEYTGDETATIAFLEVALEKARTQGVSTIWMVGEALYSQEYIFSLGDEFNLLIHNGDSESRWSQEPPPGVENAGTILTNRAFPSRDDPSMAQCLEVVEAALGVEVKTPDVLVAGETNYWAGMSGPCQYLALFDAVATAAGPDLTNESFAAAVASIGAFSIPGVPYVSLGPGKFDARDSLTLARWSNDLMAWEAISDPVDTAG